MIKKVILYITIILFIFFVVHEVFQYIKNKESLKTKVIDNFFNEIKPYTKYNYTENSIKLSKNLINDTRGTIGFSVKINNSEDSWNPALDYNIAKESSQLDSSLNEITYITDDLERYISDNIPNEKQHSLESIENVLLNINFDNDLIDFYRNNIEFKRCFRYNYSENPEKNRLITVIIGKDIEKRSQKLYLVYEIEDKPVDTDRKQIMKCMDIDIFGNKYYKLYDSQFCSPYEIIKHLQKLLKGYRYKNEMIQILEPHIQYQIIFLRYLNENDTFKKKDFLYGIDLQINQSIDVIKYSILSLFKLVQDMNHNNNIKDTEKYLELNKWLGENLEYEVHWLSITKNNEEVSICLYYRESNSHIESKRITIF